MKKILYLFIVIIISNLQACKESDYFSLFIQNKMMNDRNTFFIENDELFYRVRSESDTLKFGYANYKFNSKEKKEFNHLFKQIAEKSEDLYYISNRFYAQHYVEIYLNKQGIENTIFIFQDSLPSKIGELYAFIESIRNKRNIQKTFNTEYPSFQQKEVFSVPNDSGGYYYVDPRPPFFLNLILWNPEVEYELVEPNGIFDYEVKVLTILPDTLKSENEIFIKNNTVNVKMSDGNFYRAKRTNFLFKKEEWINKFTDKLLETHYLKNK